MVADSYITTLRLPIVQLSFWPFFWGGGKTSHHARLSAPYSPDLAPYDFRLFPKANIAVEREEICECDGHTLHKLSRRRLTADWLAPRESDCSRMRSKVSSDWLPSYIKTTRPVLEIFKMAGYFPDGPRMMETGHVFWNFCYCNQNYTMGCQFPVYLLASNTPSPET